MKRGTKPKTVAQKKLAGNPGKRALKREPKADGKAPDCPRHLDGEAKVAWKWLVTVLRGMKILASSDVAIMVLYCETWAQYVAVRLQGAKFAQNADGLGQFVLVNKANGNPYLNPIFNAESMLKKQLLQYLGELGLSPVSRARVGAGGGAAEDDPLLALMRERAEHFEEPAKHA